MTAAALVLVGIIQGITGSLLMMLPGIKTPGIIGTFNVLGSTVLLCINCGMFG